MAIGSFNSETVIDATQRKAYTFPFADFDALGKKAANKSLEVNQAMDVSNLPSGIYLLKFEDSNGTFKFIKE